MATNQMAPAKIDLNKEDAQFRAEVEAVEKWWSDSRWRYTKRPFTAEQIVVKRGNLKIDYPSNNQSKKLWETLEQRFKVSLISNVELRSTVDAVAVTRYGLEADM